MHKLLQEQLYECLGSKEIPPGLENFIKAIDDAYHQKDRLLNEQTTDSSASLQKYTELDKALKELEEKKIELIQAEKMIGLGQLIAGISHELNSPISAIVNSAEEMKKIYADFLKDLISLIENMSSSLQKQLLDSFTKVSNFNKNLSISEIREISHPIEMVLLEKGIKGARTISRNLATIGFTATDLESFIELLTTLEGIKVYQILFEFGMNRIYIENIIISADRMEKLVKALKLYTRFERDILSETDVRKDLENTLIILNNKLKRNIRIIKEFEKIPKIICYSDQLNQVWTNIINNSIEAMGESGGEIILRLKSSDNSYVIVEIEDNGSGVSADILPHIFEPHFTTKPKGKGTGLGLSICKEIIDKHKGSIDIDTKPGKTIFRIKIPVNGIQNRKLND